jgi:hypothetical protein
MIDHVMRRRWKYFGAWGGRRFGGNHVHHGGRVVWRIAGFAANGFSRGAGK